MKFKLRKGKEPDVPRALELIKELALFEKAPDEVEVNEYEMLNWGFGKEKVFEFYVAEHLDNIIGIALYYYKYSTWKGRCIFLEDIIVTEKFRGKGVGKALFDQIIFIAKTQKVRRMEWQVLEWNSEAISFYEKYRAILDPEWLNGKLNGSQIKDFNDFHQEVNRGNTN